MATRKTEKGGGKGAASKKAGTGEPVNASPKVSRRTDPDTIVSQRVGERLEAELTKRRVNMSRSECAAMSFAVILEFVQSRAMEWSLARPIRGIGDPDAETLGVAEAVLTAVADAGEKHDLPFGLPVTDWEREDVAKFLTIGFLAIREQRMLTLEANDPLAYEGGKQKAWIDDPDIPF